MRFEATKISGVFLVGLERIIDERGFFARSWCEEEFGEYGLNPHLVQCNVSFNHRAGTVRGMHYQVPPHSEAKLVRVTRGAIFDVALDLRMGSPTRCQWIGVVLSADDYRSLYIPEGCAHGFQTLEDDTEVLYQMTERYHPESAAGVRYNDPAFGIEWPAVEIIVSQRDCSFEPFEP